MEEVCSAADGKHLGGLLPASVKEFDRLAMALLVVVLAIFIIPIGASETGPRNSILSLVRSLFYRLTRSIVPLGRCELVSF